MAFFSLRLCPHRLSTVVSKPLILGSLSMEIIGVIGITEKEALVTFKSWGVNN